MARVCAQCGKTFNDATTFCTEDGSPLVPAAAALANTMLPDRMPTQEGGAVTNADPQPPTVMPIRVATAQGGPATSVDADLGTYLPPSTSPQAAPAFEEPQLIELVAGTAVGEYIVEKQIGEGGMGVIFSAKHPIIGKRVAIKVLNPDMAANVAIVQRFIQEARSVNQIGHRNIVDIFSFGRLSDGRHYFVMEFLDGIPFSKCILQPLEWPDAMAIWLQLAGAVEAAHARGIIHRDLKPDNIFITPGGEGPFVKVLDFGIAKLMGGETGVHKTSTGVPMGTPLYMSPEQTRGGAVDHRTDLYAIGCILYESVTGETPFNAPSFFEVMSKQLTEPPPPFGDRAIVDRGLEELIFQSLEKEPERRPQSMTEVRDRLLKLRDLAIKSGQPLFERAGHGWDASSTDRKLRPTGNTFHEESTERQKPRAVKEKRDEEDSSNTVPEARDSRELPAVRPVAQPSPQAAPPPAPRSSLPVVLGVVAVVAALGVVGYVALHKPEPPPAAVVLPPPATPVATKGNVKVISTESGLTFFLDGEKVAEGGPMLQVQASPGRHEIKVTRPGFLAFSTQVMVAAGETTDEVVRLEPEKAVVPQKPVSSGTHHSKDPKGPAAPPATGPKPPVGPRDKDATINPFGQ